MTSPIVKTQWQYLAERPQDWRRQLYIKGRKITALSVWSDLITNEMTPEEIALSKDIPLAAVLEAIEYCQSHQSSLQQEADEERCYLEIKGVALEPKVVH